MTAPAFAGDVALVVVDVQNDFADSTGSLAVPGADHVIAAVNELVAEAHRAGAVVVYTQDWHPPDTPHFAKDGGVWPVHCVRDTWGAQFHPRLLLDGDVIRKGVAGEDGYSGFTVRDPRTEELRSTGLTELLHRDGIRSVVVAGLATDYCVRATALDAVSLGFPTTVVRDAIAAVDVEPGDGARALDELEKAGVTLA